MPALLTLARGPSETLVSGDFFALHVRPLIGPNGRGHALALRHVALSLPNKTLLLEAPITRAGALDLLAEIQANQDAGLRLVTWGGTYHDLAILAEQTGQRARLKDICRQHVDVVHHVMCLLDVPLPLGVLAEVLKRPVNTRDPCDLAASLRDMATVCEDEGSLRWTVGDRRASLALEGGWMSVEQATTRSQQMRGYAPNPPWMRK